MPYNGTIPKKSKPAANEAIQRHDGGPQKTIKLLNDFQIPGV